MLTDRIVEIKEMYENGATLKQIAIQITGNENDRKKISKLLKENGVKVSYFKYSCNENFFEVIDTEDKAYWLGFIYADGYVITDEKYKTGKLGIALSMHDIEHLEKFKSAIDSTHNIKVYTHKTPYNEQTTYCKIVITSHKIVSDLIALGVLPRKTEILSFPTSEKVPQKLVNHFIRGYMDGDGSIVKPRTNKFQLSFCGTREFLSGIQGSLDLNLKLMKRHKNNINNWTLIIAGNKQVERLLDFIYKDSKVFLKRKYERYTSLKDLNFENYSKTYIT
ncbi:LAGLIDADG family homing endonuclease [Cytobacillus kochii]|uniref:LAGLIDADG family homing endonuclease n=1 Tax=Cytobacillus kochii TaxID=859143 RepID=UPI001CD2380C|nr:LAGLIDADG family homing endonuclease [Cytobacillus kochii]MCA1027032.1 LAGLIDADG family homing endonuclease [Cytobacillus kochii]